MALSTEGILRNFTAEDFHAVSEGEGGGEGGNDNNAEFWMDIVADLTVAVTFNDPPSPPSNLRTVNWGDGTPDATSVTDSAQHTYDGQVLTYAITATNVAGDIYDQSISFPG